ncbi:MAG: glycosyltransferase family 2 protein [Anaerolineales bacterium]|nr:glycosyltransferase family 2 protein [Anaerolineales bacterium]MCB9172247.1 glycosyltransferase family 2 protein [Ardenticatenales bacterium]
MVASTATPLVSVVVPAYNEELAIAHDLDAIRRAFEQSPYTWELIVVDDGSSDRTAEIAEAHGAVVLRHRHNRGTGGARTTGVRYARGDYVIMTDADGTYPNDRMPALIDALHHEGYDMAVGARQVERGTMRWLRLPAKEFIRRLASFMTGAPIPDLNSGLRAMRRDVVLRFIGVLPNSHSWVSTITLALLSNGYMVKYIPINYFPRIGKSSFHPIRDTYNYLSLVFRTLNYFNPLKMYLPVSLFVLLIGLSKTTWDYFVWSDIRESDIMLLMIAVLIAMQGMLADLIVTQNRRRYMAPPRLSAPPSDGRPLQD